jgi:23S rRNA (uracil1939-C5)-methyltransferase
MNLRKGQIVELKIFGMAFGGRGIGKYAVAEGDHSPSPRALAVFVDRAMPGDTVKASFTKIKSNFAEADLVEIVEPSPDRVKPKCKYAFVCGGCPLQCLKYEKQLEIKKQHTVDALERIGKIEKPNVLEIAPCKVYKPDEKVDDSARAPFYFRNKMEFSFGYDDKMKFCLGLHMPGRRFDILDLEECHLESKLSAEIVNFVRGFCEKRGWIPFKYSIGEGFLKNLYIREGKRTNEVMVVLGTSDDTPMDFDEDKKEFVEELLKFNNTRERSECATIIKPSCEAGLHNEKFGPQKITSIYWAETIAKKGTPKRVEDHLLYGKKTLTEKLILKNGDELDFEILPQAFFQVNTFQAEILYNFVVDFATEENNEVIFDLFCGTGTIGLFLAKHAEKVLGIELNEDAVKVARDNAAQNKIFNIDFFTGDTLKMLNTVKERPSLVVVDPPRAGLTEKIIHKINMFGPRKIIYVSCNPATMARDINWLGAYGYFLKKVQPVDMFPHSYHIENVCLIERP